MTPFGAIATRRDVERGVLAFLETWVPTYLRETERQQELEEGVLPDPAAFTRSPYSPEKWPESQLPAIVVVSPGTAGKARRDGGMWYAPWTIGVGCVVATGPSASREDVADLAGWYVAAVRAAVLQHPGLGGVGRVMEWLGEDYDRGQTADQRSLGIGQVTFTAEIAAVDADAGLREPPETWPPDEDPQIPAGGVTIELQREGIA